MKSFVARVSRFFTGLQLRLLLLVALACAPLVVLMLHTAGADRRRAMAAWQQRSQKMLQIARREERELYGGTRQLLLAMAESASVRSLNPRRCKRWLDELFATYPRYANLGVINTNGQVLASVLPIPGQDNQAQRQHFRRALQTRAFAVGHFPSTTADGRATLNFGYPVLDGAGRTLAVVFAELDLPWFERSDSELQAQLPKGAVWYKVDRRGTILAHYPKPDGWLGRPLPDPDLLPMAFSRPSGVWEGLDHLGVARVYAFAVMPSRLTSGEVATILSIPRQNLFAEADRLLRRNLTWLGLAAGMALALGWMGSRLLILRPVKALVRSSARLAHGDLSARTGLPHGRDELGQLTLAFDQMAQALEERELERQRASQKLQVLSHRLVEVQETERRHIARELHDEIGQSLTAAEMNLQAALQLPGGKAMLERRLAESIQAVERVLEQVHDLSLNLRPSMLDDLGLEAALRWYTRRQGELAGMQAHFRADPLEERLDPMIETECFRVAQEALTNVVRHAQAQAVSVKLTRRDDRLHLSVRDDGIGFDVSALRREAVQGASLGILSMEERATLAGGGLAFNSVQGQGTEIHAWFPLKWRDRTSFTDTNE